jgi:hypothetical protein
VDVHSRDGWSSDIQTGIAADIEMDSRDFNILPSYSMIRFQALAFSQRSLDFLRELSSVVC